MNPFLVAVEVLIKELSKLKPAYELLCDKVESIKNHIQQIYSDLAGHRVLDVPSPNDPSLLSRIRKSLLASYAATFLALCSAGFFTFNTVLISHKSPALFWLTLVFSLLAFYFAFRLFAAGLIARMLRISTESPKSVHRASKLITVAGLIFIVTFTLALLSQFVIGSAELLIVCQIGLEISLISCAGGYSAQADFWREVQALCAEYESIKKDLGQCEGEIRTAHMMLAHKLEEARKHGINTDVLFSSPALMNMNILFGTSPNPLPTIAQAAIGNNAVNQEVTV
jgi:hypothetical protein